MRLFMVFFFGALLSGCAATSSPAATPAPVPAFSSFHGDLLMAKKDQMPVAYRDSRLGFIQNQQEFASFWSALVLLPEAPADSPVKMPVIDFSRQFVLFIRNTDYYNRIRLGTVQILDKEAEPLAMETLSARKIEDKAAIAFVVLDRESVNAIKNGKERIPVPAP